MEYFIIVLIGLLIHESGHYIAAVSCGVSVRKFCVFFDPGFHLFSTGNRFKTEFCIGWIPIGGYVALKEPEEGVPPSRDCYASRSLWTRLLLCLSGPLLNLAVAFLGTYAYTEKYLDTANRYPTSVCMRYSYQSMKNRAIGYYDDVLHTFSKKENDNAKVGQNKVQKRTRKLDKARRLFLYFTSVNLFIFLFNILPCPPLDGGRIALLLYSLITGRRINDDVALLIICLGAVLLLAFLAFDYINSFISLLSNWTA